MTRDDVIKALSLCRYDPDPGQECKQLVSCDICPYWSDETGCRMTDLFTDAIALLKEKHRCSDCAHESRGLCASTGCPTRPDVWCDEWEART